MRRALNSLLLLAALGSAHAQPVRTSFYQAVAAQSDSTPWLSACGRTRSAWKQLAVTADLLRRYPCGTLLEVTLRERKGGVKTFRAVVWDTMPGWNKLDVLVGNREPARRYGTTTATLRRVR